LIAAGLLLLPHAAGAQHGKAAAASRGKAETAADRQMLATQVALDRDGFSPGEIDGVGGTKTKLALSAYQSASGSPLDTAADPLTTYTITEQDAAGPFIDTMPRDMMEEAKLSALGYTGVLEALAEKFHSSPNFLKRLNPGASWKAGEEIKVPNVEPFEIPAKAAPAETNRAAGAGAGRADRAGATGRGSAQPASKNTTPGVEVVVSGATKSLQVRDASGKILMHAPVTTGSEHDPLPIGEWKVTGVSWNPVFNYNPDLFWDANPAHTREKIPAGPNNPVGVVWVDINKEHFGLHGTPEPSTIGRTESHGCIRLTNWDATRLARLVSPGTRVIFQ
jgi:lipoprotein-anchoring transpeptidase ErfK/SrfK